tara:strand:- start:152 stop:1147 length:996 start_codon:yes stop_codon:yes gene_type:complete
MKVLLYTKLLLPARKYGGSERVIMSLAQSLHQLGHQVFIISKVTFSCAYATTYAYNDPELLSKIRKARIDIIHSHTHYPDHLHEWPVIHTAHGNTYQSDFKYPCNTLFVSKDHAARMGSDAYVHNGLNWSECYPTVNLTASRRHFHFLGKAAWRVKNLRGAVDIIKRMKSERLVVLGGQRVNFSMGFRVTMTPKVRFKGMVTDAQKAFWMSQSKGLLFPVQWHEPFGLALIESLFFGCPVFGSKHGALPEIIGDEYGFLSNQANQLMAAMADADRFDKARLHQYARDCFNSDLMARRYLDYYERVLNGETCNKRQPQLQPAYTQRYLEGQK